MSLNYRNLPKEPAEQNHKSITVCKIKVIFNQQKKKVQFCHLNHWAKTFNLILSIINITSLSTTAPYTLPLNQSTWSYNALKKYMLSLFHNAFWFPNNASTSIQKLFQSLIFYHKITIIWNLKLSYIFTILFFTIQGHLFDE